MRNTWSKYAFSPRVVGPAQLILTDSLLFSTRMIGKNATLLQREHDIQSEVARSGDTAQAIDQYMMELERILDHREDMIYKFRESMDKYYQAKSNNVA